MELIDAIKARHSVRKYTDRPIEADKVTALRNLIDNINHNTGLNIQLVLEEPKSFASGIWKYGSFAGVKNYLIMAGPKGTVAEEQIGYYGEQIVLLAQTLGLNTCWVGLTYKKIPGTFTLRDGDTVHCAIALGCYMLIITIGNGACLCTMTADYSRCSYLKAFRRGFHGSAY